MSHESSPRIVVLGGAVMDLVFPVRELPQWHQAVQAHSFRMYPGGKGLNQAIAAARLGAEVSLISAVGNDEFGERILEYLEMHRVLCDFIEVVERDYTDVTGILVSGLGDVAFVGWKGMTMRQVSKEEIRKAEMRIREADAILITFEVSLDTVQEAVSIASAKETLIVLNPAPPLDPLEPPPYTLMPDIDILVPNRWEATQLLRLGDTEAKELARLLHEMGAKIACVTDSENGCALATSERVDEYPSFVVGKPVDTTGGSDAFCAAVAIALVKGLDLESAITIANAAAALAVVKRGGAPSMPTVEEINRLLRQRGLALQLE